MPAGVTLVCAIPGDTCSEVWHLAEVDPVHEDLTLTWVVEALQQLDRRALSTTTFPCKGDLLTFLHTEAELLEHPLVRPGRVAEADIPELDRLHGFKLHRKFFLRVERALDDPCSGHNLAALR